jgi:hypothetical protein
LIDHRIHGRTRLHHDLRFARALQRSDKIRERLGEDEILPLPAARLEVFDDFDRAVENSNVESSRFHVEDEILAHDGETDEADITSAHVQFDLANKGFSIWRNGDATGNVRPVAKLFCSSALHLHRPNPRLTCLA